MSSLYNIHTDIGRFSVYGEGGVPPPFVPTSFNTCAGILEQSMEVRNRVEIGFLYRPTRLRRLAESIPLEPIPP
jgi:hypothetical protein